MGKKKYIFAMALMKASSKKILVNFQYIHLNGLTCGKTYNFFDENIN